MRPIIRFRDRINNKIEDSKEQEILIIDAEKGTVVKKKGFSRYNFVKNSAAIVENKLVLGGYKSIFIVDAEKGTITEKGGLSEATWGANSTAVVGNKVVIGYGRNIGHPAGPASSGTSILIVDTKKETVIEKGGLSKAMWGYNSTAVAGNKVVMGGHGTSILIVDAEKGTVTEKGGLSKADWGYNSTAVAGNKVVMGGSKSILIVDTEKETVTEKGGLPEADWGYNSTAVAGNKVVMGGHGTSILIVDAEKETVTEKKGLPKVGRNSTDSKTWRTYRTSPKKAKWGYNSTVAVRNKVVMGPGAEGRSILIVDAEKGTITEKKGLSEDDWGYKGTGAVGNKVVLGGSESILIVDVEKGTVTEKKGLSGNYFTTNDRTIVMRDKVILGYYGQMLIWDTTEEAAGAYVLDWHIRTHDHAPEVRPVNRNSVSITIVHVEKGTVTKENLPLLSVAQWSKCGSDSCVEVVGNKVAVVSYYGSILILDADAGTVTEKKELYETDVDYEYVNAIAVGNKVIVRRIKYPKREER